MILPPFIVCRSVAGQCVQRLGQVASGLPLHIPVPVLHLLLLAAGGVHGGFHLVQLHQILPDRLVRAVFLLVCLLQLAVLYPPLDKGQPVILTRKMASAGWWVLYSFFENNQTNRKYLRCFGAVSNILLILLLFEVLFQ